MGQKPTVRAHALTCPLISDELLAYLNATYPERCPDPKASGRSIWMDVGKREVVRHLQQEADRQRRPKSQP